MLKHPLFRTLLALRGNPKSCVYTEPLWGIPNSLYAPYVSVYMLALGLKDSQIGLLISLGLVFQIFGALLGGAITLVTAVCMSSAAFEAMGSLCLRPSQPISICPDMIMA